MEPGAPSKPMWQVAAETVASGSGALEHQALRHHAEALRQYLAVGMGSEELARAALATLRARVARLGPGELLQPPGARARLFAMARAHVLQHRQQAPAAQAEGAATLHWHRGVHTHAARVRSELSDSDRELLELHHARELSEVELGFVMNESAERVRTGLEAARTRAAQVMARPADAELADTVAAAFALEQDAQAEPHVPEALAKGTCIGGRYELEERVGVGAFGQVYRARDMAVPGHVVALKWLHHSANSDPAREAALRELRIIASVFHPSVVQFKDHGWHEDRLWFVMPWYEGETLAERIEREPLSRKEALRIFVPLANALATMHAAGIRHQDIKPDNIFLTRLETRALSEDQLHPVLIDLGVAAKEAEMLVAGTPLYFAPEVAAQYRAGAQQPPKVTHRADTFSLALTLRNALEPASRERVTGSALNAFIARRATRLPKLPQSDDLAYLKPHFEHWLSLTPELRPSAEDLAREFQVLEQPEQRRARRRALLRWLAPLAASFLVVIAAVSLVLNRRATLARSDAANARATAANESERRRQAEQTKQALEVRVQQEQAETRQLSNALNSAERRRESLSDSLHTLERKEGQLRRVVEQQETELASSKGLALELEQRRTDLQGELSNLRAQLKARDDRLAAAEADLALLRVEKGEQERAAQESVAELAAVRAQLDDVSRELALQTRELEEARKELKQLRSAGKSAAPTAP